MIVTADDRPHVQSPQRVHGRRRFQCATYADAGFGGGVGNRRSPLRQHVFLCKQQKVYVGWFVEIALQDALPTFQDRSSERRDRPSTEDYQAAAFPLGSFDVVSQQRLNPWTALAVDFRERIVTISHPYGACLFSQAGRRTKHVVVERKHDGLRIFFEPAGEKIFQAFCMHSSPFHTRSSVASIDFRIRSATSHSGRSNPHEVPANCVERGKFSCCYRRLRNGCRYGADRGVLGRAA